MIARILIVEDVAVWRETLTAKLTADFAARGIEAQFDLAENGDIAIEKIVNERKRYDLISLDVELGGMTDGLAVLKKAAEHQAAFFAVIITGAEAQATLAKKVGEERALQIQLHLNDEAFSSGFPVERYRIIRKPRDDSEQARFDGELRDIPVLYQHLNRGRYVFKREMLRDGPPNLRLYYWTVAFDGEGPRQFQDYESFNFLHHLLSYADEQFYPQELYPKRKQPQKQEPLSAEDMEKAAQQLGYTGEDEASRGFSVVPFRGDDRKWSELDKAIKDLSERRDELKSDLGDITSRIKKLRTFCDNDKDGEFDGSVYAQVEAQAREEAAPIESELKKVEKLIEETQAALERCDPSCMATCRALWDDAKKYLRKQGFERLVAHLKVAMNRPEPRDPRPVDAGEDDGRYSYRPGRDGTRKFQWLLK